MAEVTVASWQYKGMNLHIVWVQTVSQDQYDELNQSGESTPEMLALVDGHHCGYVTLDAEIDQSDCAEINVHNGVTWWEQNADGTYTYGFNCCHYFDTANSIEYWNVERVMKECHHLADQLFQIAIAEVTED